MLSTQEIFNKVFTKDGLKGSLHSIQEVLNMAYSESDGLKVNIVGLEDKIKEVIKDNPGGGGTGAGISVKLNGQNAVIDDLVITYDDFVCTISHDLSNLSNFLITDENNVKVNIVVITEDENTIKIYFKENMTPSLTEEWTLYL